MNKYTFEPSARLQRLLSRELISDPNLAVVELVKNGYDAGATEVTVGLRTDGAADPSKHTLIIADNGSGMSEVEFRRNWMHPGYSEKARNPGKAIRVGSTSRVPVGEKGLGRLAAGRLGEKLTIYTKKRGERKWFTLTVDWGEFDDMDRLLSEVAVPGGFVEDAPPEAYPSGTLLVIERMTVDLTGKVPGRKVEGRPDNRFGRLSQDLRLLTTGAGRGGSARFAVLLDVDDPSLEQYTGAFEGAESLTEGQFLLEFRIASRDDVVEIRRRCWQGDEEGNQVEIINVAGSVEEVGEVARAPHPTTLRSGLIEGSFSYAPPIRGQKAVVGVPSGVFLYRDGVRVEPYGEPDSDWLGAASRKASRQGYAPIQPKFLFGSVHIGRRENPDLTDMSNRQGLIENEAFVDLLEHVRAEFAFFEKVVQDHRQTPRWEQSQARKRQAAAQQRVDASKVQARALAHAVRQPLTGFGADLYILRRVIQDPRLPDDLRETLMSLLLKLERAAQDVNDRVQAFLQSGDEEVSDFEISTLFSEVLDRTSGIAHTLGGEVDAKHSDQHIAFAYDVLVEALVELVTNALATTGGAEPRRVTIAAESDSARVVIRVVDNGPGLPEERASRPFEVGMSSSGRPGHGLVAQKLNLLGAGGDLELVRSDPTGSEFAVTIPLSTQTLRL